MSSNPPKLSSKYKIYGAFWLGLSTAVAIRALIVLNNFSPGWVRPVWYFAVLGNFLFFYYRFGISSKRKQAIREHRLIDKVSKQESLSSSDREVLVYLLTSIKTSPEHLNYLIIFYFSLFAIVLDLLFVFFWS